MKQQLRSLLLIVAIGLFLAACGPAIPSESSQTETTAATNGEKVQIEFWYGLGGQIGEVIEEQIKKFNASQDGIEVVGVFQQSYNGVQEKFQAALVSGDVPALVQIEIHGTPKFASAGALIPLEPFFENDTAFNFDDIIPASLLNQTWDGKLYAMPINRSTPVLYYNKTMFAAAGIEPPITWQEFREMAKLFTKGEGDAKVYGYLARPDWWPFESMVWSNGGEMMNEAMTEVTYAEKGAEPLQIWLDMIYQDGTARVFTGDQGGTQLTQVFAEDKGAMFFSSTASLGGILRAVDGKFEVGTAFMPHMEGYATVVPTGGAAAGIPAAAPVAEQQAAWEFIKWWISPEQAAYWSKSTGYFPVRHSAVEILRAEGYYEEHPEFETTIKQLEFAKAAPSSPNWPVISKEITTAMEEALLNNIPALEALTKAQERTQPELE